MFKCTDCEAWFFTKDGVHNHNNYCIGYKPKELINNERKIFDIYR